MIGIEIDQINKLNNTNCRATLSRSDGESKHWPWKSRILLQFSWCAYIKSPA